MPADLVLAIEQAYKITGWYENLSEEEVPPKWMWTLDWELETWFLEIKRLRENRYGGGGGEPMEDAGGEVLENEYMARFKDD